MPVRFKSYWEYYVRHFKHKLYFDMLDILCIMLLDQLSISTMSRLSCQTVREAFFYFGETDGIPRPFTSLWVKFWNFPFKPLIPIWGKEREKNLCKMVLLTDKAHK